MPISGKTVAVVMPAFNAAATVESTYREIPFEFVDFVILVDDASQDGTVEVAKKLGLHVHVHPSNQGYGGNQKTCYREALKLGADIVVMLHPDYQYSPKLIGAMVGMLLSGHFDVVLGSRILGGKAIQGGMPVYKYIANRILTLIENLLTGAKLSEYHTGFRAFTREVLTSIPLNENSNDFVFDNEVLLQAHFFGYRIGELTCPARYFAEASSINFSRSIKYGIQVLWAAAKFRLEKMGWFHFSIFDPTGKRLEMD